MLILEDTHFQYHVFSQVVSRNMIATLKDASRTALPLETERASASRTSMPLAVERTAASQTALSLAV